MLVYLHLQQTCQIVCHFSIHGVFNVASNFLAMSVFQLEYAIIDFPRSNIRAVLNMRQSCGLEYRACLPAGLQLATPVQ